MFQMLNLLDIKKIVWKTPERLLWPGNERNPNRPPQPTVPTLMLKSLLHSNILLIFEFFLIHHW